MTQERELIAKIRATLSDDDLWSLQQIDTALVYLKMLRKVRSELFKKTRQ